jgi:two-component system NtrC family sensor kinase
MVKPVILCVDDEHILLESLRDELRDTFEQRFLIEIADGGENALELVQELLEEGFEIPLVISDYIMPDMRGDELLRKIHERLPKTLKVMLTGQATIEAVSNAVKHAKLYRYIAKPWEQEDLRLTVLEAVNSYEQDKRLAEKNQQLMVLNQALEEANHTLEQRVVARTQELSAALESLKAAQESLIQSEKMAALGQLVAGIAHEINTPMGAIRASIGSLIMASARALEDLPDLLRQLSPERLADFHTLLAATQVPQPILVSREERKARRSLTADLTAAGIANAETLAMKLVTIGITQDIQPFIPVLKDPEGDRILNAVQSLTIQRNSSERIQLAVEKASKIITALKRYVYQGDTSKKIQANLRENIDMVLTIYHNSLKQGVEVFRKYEEIPNIWCYPDELNQVWTNLVHNAIQAMQGTGTLTITLMQVGDRIRVQFTDTGCGIPPDIQAKIFDPFFTTKPVGEGSGMGLSIVHRIIERHQGTITLESQPGQTTFTVWLPIAETPTP